MTTSSRSASATTIWTVADKRRASADAAMANDDRMVGVQGEERMTSPGAIRRHFDDQRIIGVEHRMARRRDGFHDAAFEPWRVARAC